MNPRKKEIASIESGSCAESYPCQHSLTIKYKDGTAETTWMNGREVAKEYYKYLNARDKIHFLEYRKTPSFFEKWFGSEIEEVLTKKTNMIQNK